MKSLPSYLKKAAIVLFLAIVVGGVSAFAQTFVKPSALAPASSVPTLLNIGSAAQTMAGQLWAASIGANSLAVGGNLWDVEGGLSTIHIQQLCIIGNRCLTSFPAASASAVTFPLTYDCNGGLCYGDAFTAAKVCSIKGYTHLVSAVGAGGGYTKVCTWSGSSWSCDGNCGSSCTSRTLTSVSCDNNGTSRLQ